MITVDQMKVDSQGRVLLPWLHRPDGIWLTKETIYEQQVFSHLSLDDGQWRHFYVPEMIQMTRTRPHAVELISTPVTAKQARFLMRHHGIEQDHLWRIGGDRLNEPGILVHMLDDTDILVDGNHRFVRRWQLGRPSMRFWRFTEAQARGAMVDLPLEMCPKVPQDTMRSEVPN